MKTLLLLITFIALGCTKNTPTANPLNTPGNGPIGGSSAGSSGGGFGGSSSGSGGTAQNNSGGSSSGGGSQNTGGTIFGGGGNGCNGKILESYIQDVTKQDYFKEEIEPILNNIKSLGFERLYNHLIGTAKHKVWYFAPCKGMDVIPKVTLGVAFDTEQLALQTHREVYIDSNLFEKKSKQEKALLILHELVMGSYIYPFYSDKLKDQFDTNSLTERMNALNFKSIVLTSEDYYNVRSFTHFLNSEVKNIDVSNLRNLPITTFSFGNTTYLEARQLILSKLNNLGFNPKPENSDFYTYNYHTLPIDPQKSVDVAKWMQSQGNYLFGNFNQNGIAQSECRVESRMSADGKNFNIDLKLIDIKTKKVKTEKSFSFEREVFHFLPIFSLETLFHQRNSEAYFHQTKIQDYYRAKANEVYYEPIVSVYMSDDFNLMGIEFETFKNNPIRDGLHRGYSMEEDYIICSRNQIINPNSLKRKIDELESSKQYVEGIDNLKAVDFFEPGFYKSNVADFLSIYEVSGSTIKSTEYDKSKSTYSVFVNYHLNQNTSSYIDTSLNICGKGITRMKIEDYHPNLHTDEKGNYYIGDVIKLKFEKITPKEAQDLKTQYQSFKEECISEEELED